ncbi:aminotransferase (plasmid) [Azospirillum brasilense]|uniref:Aminotransferase n=1 Tax=Azospirillum brasilense TaxID=192 RepID=A0A4D8R377_AZOBR|nr:aminotransferase [Azospirillum brasilense]QCO17815.1 aminotransferase [Azospirillum brasilense]
MKSGNAILSSYGTTIFEVMSRLSDEHKAINLGQGFPDERGPADVLDVAAKAVLDGWNQYPPMMGTPELRQAVAAHGKRFYGLDIDWKTEVMVTSGATEALTASLLGLINPGDEVVLFQPMYDSYLPIVRLAGGVPRFVSLKAPDWSFTRADLEAVFSSKTKLVLINDPLNPAAKVFTRAELELLAEFVQRFDAFAVCDEVYEHIIFDGLEHIPLMTLPGMRDRCLKIGSAGKTFSLTGWKVGYVTGAPHLLQPVVKAHQYITFTTPPNLQAAVAYGLGKDGAYFTGLATGLQAKRDRLADGLRAVGFEVLPSAGTYFVVADVSPFGFDGNDEDFCRRLTAEAGVTAIPVGAFFVEDAPRSFIRFCFSKKDEILDGAVERLNAYFSRK